MPFSHKEYNKEYHKEYSKKYRANNKEKIKETTKKYKSKNKESIKKYNKEYSKRPEVLKRENKRKQLKRDTDSIFRLNNSLSSGIRISLKGNKLIKNKRKWEELVGYTIQDLKEHLENLFLPGMTWKNYGQGGWVTDHIIPKEFFKFTSTDDVEFKYCWSLNNLQPLWVKDNIEKNDKITLWGKETSARLYNREE